MDFHGKMKVQKKKCNASYQATFKGRRNVTFVILEFRRHLRLSALYEPDEPINMEVLTLKLEMENLEIMTLWQQLSKFNVYLFMSVVSTSRQCFHSRCN
jgi:hypothetical protein